MSEITAGRNQQINISEAPPPPADNDQEDSQKEIVSVEGIKSGTNGNEDVGGSEINGVNGDESVANPLAGNDISQIIDENPDSRKALEILSMKPEDLNKELVELEASSNPEDKAFAADFKIALKQRELAKLEGQSAKSPAEQTRMEQRKEELDKEIKAIQEQRGEMKKEGKVIPNKVDSLAQKFGINDTNNPLGEIIGEINRLEEMTPDQRKTIYEGYKKSEMTEQEIAFLEDGIKAIQGKKKRERVAGIAAKVGLGSLIFMIFMMISAFKQGDGGAQ